MQVDFDVRELSNLIHQLSEKRLKVALKRAMKKTSITLRKKLTELTKKELPGVKAGAAKKAMKPVYPKGSKLSDLEGGIKVVDTPSPLTNFKGRKQKGRRIQGSRKRENSGYKVTVKRKDKLIKGAFKAKMKNGKVGIFIRKSDNSRPIKMLFTTKIYDIVKDEVDKDKVLRGIEYEFAKKFEQELKYELSQI